MFLKTVTLRNFRSFDHGQVELQKDLTVFVGENNGGKSNAQGDEIAFTDASLLPGRARSTIDFRCGLNDQCHPLASGYISPNILIAPKNRLIAGHDGKAGGNTVHGSLTAAPRRKNGEDPRCATG